MPAVTHKRRGRPPMKKTAPSVSVVDELYRDESEEIVKRAKEALGAKATGKHFGYGDKNKDTEYYTSQGWEFVFIEQEDGTRKQLWDRGDPLMMIDEERYARRHGKLPAEVSRQQLRSALVGKDGQSSVRDRDGGLHGLEPM
jgi:hypothetical protein